MIDPRLLYTFNPEVWSSLDGKRPVLIHLFEGYVDAAAVNRGLATHILAHCKHEVLAEFDHDQLDDYRSRRPQMVFDTNKWVSMSDFSLLLYKVLDAEGQPFLLLSGPEPDTQWRRMTQAVLGIAERLDSAMLLTGSGDRMSAACFAAAALECTGEESRPCGVCPALHWKPPLRQRCWCCWQ